MQRLTSRDSDPQLAGGERRRSSGLLDTSELVNHLFVGLVQQEGRQQQAGAQNGAAPGGVTGRRRSSIMEASELVQNMFSGLGHVPQEGAGDLKAEKSSGRLLPRQLPRQRGGVETDVFTDEALLLVLYTGGTIGMRKQQGVYMPEPNFLVPELRRQPLFHDSSYTSLYSRKRLQTTSENVATAEEEEEGDMPLVLPLSKEGKRIVYCIYEYEPLLDSSNMTYDDYARLATDIQDNYSRFDGFVVLHGTDTMAYTASALSFMLENLGKPVILTGSQIPIFEQRSDGRDNFLSALIMAGHYNIPEVAIMFDNKLLRGNRTTKIDSGGFFAFHSHNINYLASLEIDIRVNWDIVFRHRGLQCFQVNMNMCPNVGVLRIFPSITEATVRAFLQPPMQGVVLQTYGSGNGPAARVDLMNTLKEANDRGVIIVNTTQCTKGTVSPLYEAGKALANVGVIAGCDMTVEGALMKLSYILSKDSWSLSKKKQMMESNLRGEMTVAHTNEEQSLLEYSLIDKMAETMKLSSVEEIQILRDAIFPPLLCSAARDGNVEALEKLQSAGAQLSLGDYDGRTALHIACCEGHGEAVNYLLDLGSTVHIKDRYGHSPLDDAIRFNQHDIIAILMKAGAHLRMPPAKLGMLMCNTAVHEGLMAMQSWKLAGADLNQGDYDGRTPLHLAAVEGDLPLVEYLLKSGANPSQHDLFGHTSLDEARKRSHKSVIMRILEHMKSSDFSHVQDCNQNNGEASEEVNDHNTGVDSETGDYSTTSSRVNFRLTSESSIDEIGSPSE